MSRITFDFDSVMKFRHVRKLPSVVFLCVFSIIASCSGNDDPPYPVFMQQAAIVTSDVNGANQSFEYDDYGRIVEWSLTSNNPSGGSSYTAKFSYPDPNTIHIVSEEAWNDNKRCFDETIQMINGRAAKSEGTFMSYFLGNIEMTKTYRLEYEYDQSNHLAIVKHSEVIGIGNAIKSGAWDNPWSWENYLIWEEGNLKEFQDFQGHRSVYQTTRYNYSFDATDNTVIVPMVINSAHHLPLIMQGVFGLNSINLVDSSSVIDSMGNVILSRQFSYEIEQGRIIEYTETECRNEIISNPITYKVDWTEK